MYFTHFDTVIVAIDKLRNNFLFTCNVSVTREKGKQFHKKQTGDYQAVSAD